MTTKSAYLAMHRNPVYNIPVLNTTLGNVLSALSTHNWTTVTGGLEHRGLHWTDRRFTALTNIHFVKGHPNCSILELLGKQIEAKKAVQGRSAAAKKMTYSQYMQSLIIRNVRGQIQNPVLRYDYVRRMMEKLRAVSNKWVRLAMNPHNAQAAVTQILFN